MLGRLKSKKHLFCMLIPLILALLYLFFCLINLKGSIWFDEAYSAYLIRGNLVDIWTLTAADVHPPFFYFCLKIWSLIFGNFDFALRFMSIFFGAVTIILAFHLLKRWFGIKPATIGTTLLAISPIFIRYGQEMRMYTLVFAIVIAATYVLELALANHKKRYWILYAILLTLGMYTHYFVILAWSAHLFYLKFILHRKLLKSPILPTFILAILLYLPWLPSFITQFTTVQKGFWIKSLTAATPIDYLSNTLIFTGIEDATNWLAPLIFIVVILTTLFIIRVFRKLKTAERKNYSKLLSLAFFPPVLLMLLSLPPLKPMFVDRYILYAASLLWALIGVTLMLYHKLYKVKLLPLLFTALMLISSTIGIIKVETREPEEYIKDAVAMTTLLASENEPILMNDIWNYYGAVFYSTPEHPICIPDDWIAYEYGSEQPVKEYQVNIIQDLDDFAATHERIWYITNAPGSDSTSAQMPSTVETVADPESPLDGYEIKSETSDGHYLVLELEKS